MKRGPDIDTILARAIEAAARRQGCVVKTIAADSTRWASATFNGARHHLTLAALPSPRLNDWLSALPDAEFNLRGHLVADLATRRISHRPDLVDIGLEILTLEER
jgi:hypothetical protein